MSRRYALRRASRLQSRRRRGFTLAASSSPGRSAACEHPAVEPTHCGPGPTLSVPVLPAPVTLPTVPVADIALPASSSAGVLPERAGLPVTLDLPKLPISSPGGANVDPRPRASAAQGRARLWINVLCLPRSPHRRASVSELHGTSIETSPRAVRPAPLAQLVEQADRDPECRAASTGPPPNHEKPIYWALSPPNPVPPRTDGRLRQSRIWALHQRRARRTRVRRTFVT